VARALPEAAAKTLLHAFMSCRLDYCNALLYGITDNLFRCLQSIQNAAARHLTDTRLHEIFIMLSVAVARFSSDDNAIGYVMTSCFHNTAFQQQWSLTSDPSLPAWSISTRSSAGGIKQFEWVARHGWRLYYGAGAKSTVATESGDSVSSSLEGTQSIEAIIVIL